SSELRGIKWQSEGGGYAFTLARAVISLRAGDTETPAITTAGSTTSLTLDDARGNFAAGRLKASVRGIVNSEFAALHSGDASFETSKAQSSFSSLTLDVSADSWTATGDIRTIVLASGVRYPMTDGIVSLASLNADVAGSGTV